MSKMTLKLPKLAVSMQSGTLVEWLVASEDTVSVGQPIYAVETEKTSTEVASPFAGRIVTIGQIGENYPVGTPIAEIHT
ncbi:biotin/lipoyl-containing protein [Sphingomonas sp. RB1R13]|uniref:biotin/lipoyl-containing protein n=1 Tax=Sphingomonas sp. RB1R13 TaxID=3096159 RepID=UPI002FC7BA7A